MSWLKIGELAKRTALTVRTLHHYDEIDLLKPSRRSAAGYRLYGREDVVRLQAICSLRQTGSSLAEIRDLLAKPDLSVLEVIELHLTRLREQLAQTHELCDRLEEIARHLRATERVSVDDFLKTIEEMTMYEKYYNREQQDWLKQRALEVGEERIRQAPANWQAVFDGFRTEMEAGNDPAAEGAQAWARKARGLIEEFTGGRADVARSLSTLHREEGTANVVAGHGMELAPGVGEYMSRAMAALGEC